jgi:hypothetical protein
VLKPVTGCPDPGGSLLPEKLEKLILSGSNTVFLESRPDQFDPRPYKFPDARKNITQEVPLFRSKQTDAPVANRYAQRKSSF